MLVIEMQSLRFEDNRFNWVHEICYGKYNTELIGNVFFFFVIQGARQQSRMQELQTHLERLTRDKMTLEAKIVELTQYQNEVVALRNEITKLQVRFFFLFCIKSN